MKKIILIASLGIFVFSGCAEKEMMMKRNYNPIISKQKAEKEFKNLEKE